MIRLTLMSSVMSWCYDGVAKESGHLQHDYSFACGLRYLRLSQCLKVSMNKNIDWHVQTLYMTWRCRLTPTCILINMVVLIKKTVSGIWYRKYFHRKIELRVKYIRINRRFNKKKVKRRFGLDFLFLCTCKSLRSRFLDWLFFTNLRKLLRNI